MSNLRENASLVDALASCLRSGNHALGTAPSLLKRILREEMWRDFITQRGEHVQHERFTDFAKARPLKGINTPIWIIRKLVEDDAEALDLLDQAMQNPVGTNVPHDNIQGLAPTGTAKAQALRKLRVDAPELHSDVLAGKLSAHAAMVQAGYRAKTFTVRGDDPQSIARVLRKQLSEDVLAELASLLSP